MIALLSPKVWLALAIAVLLAVIGGQQLRIGAAKLTIAKAATELSDLKLSTSESTRLLQAANDKDAARRLVTVNKAINDSAQRLSVLQISRDQLHTQLGGLQRSVAANDAARRNILSSDAADAAGATPSTPGLLLVECGKALVDMADAADTANSSLQTLSEAWPK